MKLFDLNQINHFIEKSMDLELLLTKHSRGENARFTWVLFAMVRLRAQVMELYQLCTLWARLFVVIKVLTVLRISGSGILLKDQRVPL